MIRLRSFAAIAATCCAILCTSSIGRADEPIAKAQGDVRALFAHFIDAQNAHDATTVSNLLWDSPDFLWVTRGTQVHGRDAAVERFRRLYGGVWQLTADVTNLDIVVISADSARATAPVRYTIGATPADAVSTTFILNLVCTKTQFGWRVAAIYPIPVPAPTPTPTPTPKP